MRNKQQTGSHVEPTTSALILQGIIHCRLVAAVIIGFAFGMAPSPATAKNAAKPKTPNLIVKVMKVEVSAAATPRVTAEVSNDGTGDAGAFYASVHVDGNEIGWQKIASLNAGKSTTLTITGEVTLNRGKHTVKVIADDTNGISESSESDNSASEKFEVKNSGSGFVHPLKNPTAKVNHAFGEPWDGNPLEKIHTGVDLAAKAGDPIFAAKDGFVEWLGEYRAADQKKWKSQIVIDTLTGDPVELIYIHVEPKSGLRAGDMVFAGDKIGTVAKIFDDAGREVTHLHFAIRQGPYKSSVSTKGALPMWKNHPSGDPVFPEKFVDPQKYLPKK